MQVYVTPIPALSTLATDGPVKGLVAVEMLVVATGRRPLDVRCTP